MRPQEFSRLVEDVMEDLPPDFAEALEQGNIGVCVQPSPTPEELEAMGVGPGTTLLGSYHGTPPTSRGLGYSLVLPDNIVIYRETVEQYARRTGRPLNDVVREVVLHEIAHHFGLPDSRLRELGY